MFATSDYDYTLPEHLIARHPPDRRDAARMLVVHRDTGTLEHRSFTDFPAYLRPGDLAVLNDTRVIPARVFSDDRRIELLFLESLGENVWRCLVKPGRKMRPGALIHVQGIPGVVQSLEDDGTRRIAFHAPIDLEAAGELPLPPYFSRPVELADKERYQTVFAQSPGAIAAPTAGLHFTPEILARVPHTFLTLHVGVGTFRPVQVEDLRQHHMHQEHFIIGPAAAAAINAASRLIAIGTTTTRVLESCGRPLQPQSGSTDIFLHPPFPLTTIGALLTNFHLPRSTLLMLVSAFAGRDLTLRAYHEAIEKSYRFYSYGDCMLIV